MPQDLDCYDIQTIDPELGKTLLEMQLLVRRKQYLELQSGDNRKVVEELSLRGSKIEDLCLDFTLPGQPDYVLKPGGNNLMVRNLPYFGLTSRLSSSSTVLRLWFLLTSARLCM